MKNTLSLSAQALTIEDGDAPITSIKDDRLFALDTMETAYEKATPSVQFYVDTILTHA